MLTAKIVSILSANGKLKKEQPAKNEGSRYRYCTKCYKYENESIPKLTTHYYRVLDKAVEATCEKTGLTEGVHCEFCNTVLQKQEIIPKLEHTVVISDEVLPTCKTVGYTEGHYCTTCRNYLIEREVIPKLEHESVIDEAVEPTCESSGRTEGSHCGACGTTIVAQNRIELLPHNYGSNEVCIDCSASKASYGLSYSLIGDNYYVNGIGTCTDTEIIIPSVYDGKKVVTISAGAFRGCTNIVSVEMSDNIRTIGSSAFEGCTSLRKIRLSSSVTTLASCVFKDCTSLTDVDFSFIKTFESKSLSYCYIKSVVIPDGATLELNFCRESNVESVYIGENIHEIPVNAFWGCKKLKEVIFK